MAAASNFKAKGSNSNWPTREKKRQLEMDGVMEVGESFRFLRRLSMTHKPDGEMSSKISCQEDNSKDWVTEAGIDDKEWKKEKDWMKEGEELDEPKELDGALETSGEHGATAPDGQDLEEIPVEHPADRTADAVAARLRSELAKAHEEQDLARWQGYQEGVDWALDSVQEMEANGSKGKDQHKGKGSGKNHGHGSGGKGKHAHGKGKGWHHAKAGNRPHWAKHRWREAPLPQEKAGAFGTAGAKGTGKGKYDAWGGEYCIGGYRAVSGEFYP